MTNPHTDSQATLGAAIAATIPRPPEVVYEYLSRLENNRHWNWSVISTIPLTPGPVRPGSRYAQTSAAEPDEPHILKVTAMQPPHLLEVEARGSRMDVTYRYRLEAAGQSATEVRVEAEVRLCRPIGLPDLFMARLHNSLKANLDCLHTLLTSSNRDEPR